MTTYASAIAMPPRKGYFQCCCGTYLERGTRRPVEPHEPSPEVFTVGVLQCSACQGTPYDLFTNTRAGEYAGDTRRRIGPLPDSLRRAAIAAAAAEAVTTHPRAIAEARPVDTEPDSNERRSSNADDPG
jgi:hypothetical protein